MIYCKGCGGKLMEEETYKEDEEWKIQLGCFMCWRKVYIDLKTWNKFKDRLSVALGYN